MLFSITAILGSAAKTAAGKLGSWGYTKVTESNVTEYESELYHIIYKTIEDFGKDYPIKETDKIPFYTSQVILDELLKFRFTQKLDKTIIEKEILKDTRIIPPIDNQLELFFGIFDSHIKESKILYDLNIKYNYKEEIFHVSSEINKLQNDIAEIIRLLKRESLTEEPLSDYEMKLLIRLHEFQSPCKIASAKGEYECLWVPGFAMDMQWGWERTPEEAELSGKPIGDRKNRLHWIFTVKQLVAKGLLKETENNHYELTDKGNMKGYKLKHNEKL